MGEGFGKYREFEVNPSSGAICIAAELDHEKRNIYEFPILATDRGKIRERNRKNTVTLKRRTLSSIGGLSTTAMVKIQVIDVNDNRPMFYPREYNVSLRERETVNSPVVVVVATDKDSGKFGAVRYAIVAGNEENLFRVETSSGEIFLTRPLTRSRLAHRLNISATDGAGLRSSTDAEVLITVIDRNHQPPIFEANRYLFAVREDAPRNTVIGTVSAVSVTGNRIFSLLHFLFVLHIRVSRFFNYRDRVTRTERCSSVAVAVVVAPTCSNYDHATVRSKVMSVGRLAPSRLVHESTGWLAGFWREQPGSLQGCSTDSVFFVFCSFPKD